MSQPNFYQVDGDDNGATYNVKLQDLISALTTSFSGNVAPSVTSPSMQWIDTSTSPPTQWRRDVSNTYWDKEGQFSNNIYYGSVTGSSGSTAKLDTARAISISGDGSGSTSFDGSANANIALTLANSGVTAGTYGGLNVIPRIIFDAKGRATGVTTYAVTYPITSFNGRGGTVTLQTSDVIGVLPSLTGNARKFLRVSDSETGVEWASTSVSHWNKVLDTYTANNVTYYDLLSLSGLGRYLVKIGSETGFFIEIISVPASEIVPTYATLTYDSYSPTLASSLILASIGFSVGIAGDNDKVEVWKNT